jgi:hypothetical protein
VSPYCSIGICNIVLNEPDGSKSFSESGMASSGMLRHVALVRTYVSEELSASFIRVTRIELGTMLAVTSNQCMM